MQKNFIKFKSSSKKLISHLMSKLKMVKHDTTTNSSIAENSDCSGNGEDNENNQYESSRTIAIPPTDIQLLCEQLEQFIHDIKISTNFEYLVHVYPLNLEKRLENSIQELECMLREIKNVHDNVQKQKMQQKFMDKEKMILKKTLKKLKDNEMREMETIISLFDNTMYNRWLTMKSTRKSDILERFLSDIKSKQLALENLNTLVSRKLTNITIVSSSSNDVKRKIFSRAIPLPFLKFESPDLAIVSQSSLSSLSPPTPSPSRESNNTRVIANTDKNCITFST